MAIYMRINNINGDVSAQGYDNWIEIDNLNHSIKKNITQRSGSEFNRNIGIPKLSHISITKQADSATSLLFQQSLETKDLGEVLIHVCQTGSSLQPYLEYTLDDVIISDFELNAENSGNEETSCFENLELSYSKISIKYTPRDKINKTKSPIAAGYNLSTAEIS